jgi:hypothetical protein
VIAGQLVFCFKKRHAEMNSATPQAIAIAIAIAIGTVLTVMYVHMTSDRAANLPSPCRRSVSPFCRIVALHRIARIGTLPSRRRGPGWRRTDRSTAEPATTASFL